MSREDHRSRIPTSEELERQGLVAPAGVDGTEKKRGLFGFFRASRIRVASDVAEKKFVPTERRYPQTPNQIASESTVQPPTSEAITQPPTLTPRRIHIDASVRARRGLGSSDRSPNSNG